MYLQLHGVMLKLIDTDDKKVLMTQSIAGIRLFGAGRDCGQLVIFKFMLWFMIRVLYCFYIAPARPPEQ